MSLEDIYGIDLKLRFARQATAAYTEDDKIRRYNLSKLMFGGWHVIFLGDFFQLPPVGGTRIYSTDTTNMKKQAVIGRELWTKINTYAELTQNFRCRNHPNDMLPPFLQSARVGKADKQLVEQINDQCYATHKDDMKCHPQALWISPTNAQVDLYNKQAFDRLVATGVATYRAVAIHSIADHSMKNKITSIKVIQNLFKATTTVVGKKVTRLASTDINFAIGQRVRVTQNLATQLGIFNGALGKIIGFHFDEDKEMHEEWMNPKNIAAYRLSQHKRQQNTPIIYVQLDKVKNDITCENQSGGANIIPFFMEANSFACINTDGCKYTRKQYPLEPCSATTTHKSQGITAEFGVVFHPGDPKTSNFAHSYVSVSRCQCCGVMKDYPDYNTLTILGPLSQLHFNRHQKSIEMVKAEYRRFESISDNNIFNIRYSE